MKLSAFLRDKWVYLLEQALLAVFLWTILQAYTQNASLALLVGATAVIFSGMALLVEYIQKSRYYNRLLKTLDGVEEKHLIAQLLEEADFAEGRILDEVLTQAAKSMNDRIAGHARAQEDYREYIETWVHEIRLPISSVLLLCENNKGRLADSVAEETARIDGYVEQALYYARSAQPEKDYVVRPVQLDALIKDTLKRHARVLIGAQARIRLALQPLRVHSDPKWLEFMIGQVLANSIRYRRQPFELTISVREDASGAQLSIADNGIGIPAQDVGRVFEKGFTGENGRERARSTGMGLYLCRQLCDKLHIGLAIASTQGEGTQLTFTFPADKMALLREG